MKARILGVLFALILINVIIVGVRYVQLEYRAEKYELNKEFTRVRLTEQTSDTSNAQQPLYEQVPTENSIAKSGYKMAVVLDDLGVKTIRYFLLERIPYKLNFAIIPGLKDSQMMVRRYAVNPQYELLLHMPMEPVIKNGDRESHEMKTYNYQYMIRSDMKDKQIKKELDEALEDVKGYGMMKGMNNHMGSWITSSANMMRTIVKWAESNNMYFLDSMTTGASVAYEIAKKEKLNAVYNEMFLDGKDDIEYITRQLYRAAELARTNGQVIAIGHIQRENTVEALFKEMPKLRQQGIEFVHVSELF